MKCIINGDNFTFDKALSIQEVIQELDLDETRMIVEHNEQLIQREQFSQHKVTDEDRLELLEFVGGG
ncbi:sulfur carrier protein ThiS [Staphylococcus equorum]|uniref:sulfur carrier protein ThiS n=1 Tax=Staphylococcus equorum TaxID=246432 RepID=UPI0008537D1C|nr:sulfur carrier protein ThiS [Staphylococcus equorum]OEK76966.1 thiamine biosynthesis protein ThiS [Staphylococcus equorum]PTE93911.1 thiamine biosynthesis protein ThiS [Staphylococcus equorum]RIL29302.1 sulfur carrier protein ThiS [Staphylococcus equorum]